MEIEPNLIWRRHTDQLKACNVPVTDHFPVFHPVPSPTIIENHGDQVPKPREQSETVSSETVDQSHSWASRHITHEQSLSHAHFHVQCSTPVEMY